MCSLYGNFLKFIFLKDVPYLAFTMYPVRLHRDKTTHRHFSEEIHIFVQHGAIFCLSFKYHHSSVADLTPLFETTLMTATGANFLIPLSSPYSPIHRLLLTLHTLAHNAHCMLSVTYSKDGLINYVHYCDPYMT